MCVFPWIMPGCASQVGSRDGSDGEPSGGSPSHVGDSGGGSTGGDFASNAGGYASGGAASDGGSAGSQSGSGGVPIHTGGEGSGGTDTPGTGGGANPDAPCAVPNYIYDQPSPVGWASMDGGTTGGGAGARVLVTSLEQLKSELSGSEPKVVYVQGTFLPGDISVGSNKTIIGCSSGAHISGHLGIGSGSFNVIIRNLTVSGYAVGDCALDPDFDAGEGCSSGQDAISVNGSAHHVWFDHCLVKDGTDGNLDITNEADFVTVSWTKFSYTPRTDHVGSDSTGASGHRYSNLVGGSNSAPEGFDADDPLNTAPLNVTWHHNWWADNIVERMPRVRYGKNHLFNNYFSSSTANYCVRAGIYAHILLEGNFFDGVDSPHQFNSDSDRATAFIARGDGARENVYANTSGDQAVSGDGEAWTNPPYAHAVDAAQSVPESVQTGAGPH